jgi:ABC-type multidrug transport system fused ATPase/permease subunit
VHPARSPEPDACGFANDPNTPIIEFDHFTFQYYSQAEPTLVDINLKIYPGEKILIVGPSGSGKSSWDTA